MKLKKIFSIKNLTGIICFFLNVLFSVTSVYAGDIGNSKLVTGTTKLMSDITLALTGGAAAFFTIFAIVTALQWGSASSEEKPKYKKKLISILIAVGVTISLASIIAIISAYYT